MEFGLDQTRLGSLLDSSGLGCGLVRTNGYFQIWGRVALASWPLEGSEPREFGLDAPEEITAT